MIPAWSVAAAGSSVRCAHTSSPSMPTKQGFGVNLALLIGVALPCVVATYFLRTECPALAKRTALMYALDYNTRPPEPSSNWWDLSNICKLGIEHPVWALNVIYFINVNIIFWIISLWQDSTWVRHAQSPHLMGLLSLSTLTGPSSLCSSRTSITPTRQLNTIRCVRASCSPWCGPGRSD